MFIYLYIFGYLKVAIILTIPPNTYITETFNIDLREAFLIIIKTFQKLKTNYEYQILINCSNNYFYYGIINSINLNFNNVVKILSYSLLSFFMDYIYRDIWRIYNEKGC